MSFERAVELCSDLFFQYRQYQRKLEVLRQVLCEKPEFEPYAAFKRLDQGRQNYFTSYELTKFMNDNRIKCSQLDCEYFISKYDKYGDLKITYAEFLNAVLPQDNKMLRQIACQRPTYDLQFGEFLNQEVEYALSRLIETEILSVSQLEGAKLLLQDYLVGFSLRDLFHEIDYYQMGYIDCDNLRKFYRKKGVNLPQEQALEMIRSLDRDENYKITFEEFEKGFTPYKPANQSRQYNSLQKSKSELFSISQKKLINPNKTSQKTRPQTAQINISQNIFIEQKQCVKSLKQFILLDQELEIAKQDLSIQADFNLQDSFRIFDFHERGLINVKEITKGLETLDLFADKYDLFLFVRKYDLDGDGKLSFVEYSDAFLPYKRDLSDLVCSRTPFGSIYTKSLFEVFSKQTVLLFVNVIKTHLQNEAVCEALRQRLSLRKNFNLNLIFKSLDADGDGFLSNFDIRKSFESHGIEINSTELRLLFAKIDRNNDGLISFSEFVQSLTPTSPKKYNI